LYNHQQNDDLGFIIVGTTVEAPGGLQMQQARLVHSSDRPRPRQGAAPLPHWRREGGELPVLVNHLALAGLAFHRLMYRPLEPGLISDAFLLGNQSRSFQVVRRNAQMNGYALWLSG